jgi:hypothetical protein
MERNNIKLNTFIKFSVPSVIFFVCFVIIFSQAHSQQTNLPLNYEWMQETEAKMVHDGGYHIDQVTWDFIPDTTEKVYIMPYVTTSVHTSMRPMIEHGSELRRNMVLNNNDRVFKRNPYIPSSKVGKWAQGYHCTNSLLQVRKAASDSSDLPFRLYIDPLLNLQYMNVADDTSSSQFYINTRGVTARGDIGRKVSFETSFWENQAFFPRYIKNFADQSLVVPGQGRWKTFKRTGYDFASATGYVSYSPFRFFNLQLGNGKFFVGDGYRSLLLSDNGFNFPFARFTGWIGKKQTIQYTSIYASLMNLQSISPIPVGTERLFQKKAASFHQIAIRITQFAEVSFFQGLIWTAADSSNRQCIRLAYANPLIFSALPGQGLSGKNNFLLGATFRVDLLKTIRLYGQFVADDLGKKGTVHNKTGFQLGLKYFNAFTLKHLHIQAEINRVKPYTYAATDPAQSYTHYNQPLAHPLGANFTEMVFYLHYKIGDFFLQARYSTAKLGTDNAPHQNYGQNVFTTDYAAYFPSAGQTYTVGQGVSNTVTYLDARLGYMVSYASNLNISLGFVQRNVDSTATSLPTSYVYVAVRTSLTNTYYDFFKQ